MRKITYPSYEKTTFVLENTFTAFVTQTMSLFLYIIQPVNKVIITGPIKQSDGSNSQSKPEVKGEISRIPVPTQQTGSLSVRERLPFQVWPIRPKLGREALAWRANVTFCPTRRGSVRDIWQNSHCERQTDDFESRQPALDQSSANEFNYMQTAITRCSPVRSLLSCTVAVCLIASCNLPTAIMHHLIGNGVRWSNSITVRPIPIPVQAHRAVAVDSFAVNYASMSPDV